MEYLRLQTSMMELFAIRVNGLSMVLIGYFELFQKYTGFC